MVFICAVYGCTNTAIKGKRSLHTFPKDRETLIAWKRFIIRTRGCWKGPSRWDRICSDHFTAGDYDNYVRWTMGLSSKLVLKELAVPTLYPQKRCENGSRKKTEQGHKKRCCMKNGQYGKFVKNKYKASKKHRKELQAEGDVRTGSYNTSPKEDEERLCEKTNKIKIEKNEEESSDTLASSVLAVEHNYTVVSIKLVSGESSSTVVSNVAKEHNYTVADLPCKKNDDVSDNLNIIKTRTKNVVAKQSTKTVVPTGFVVNEHNLKHEPLHYDCVPDAENGQDIKTSASSSVIDVKSKKCDDQIFQNDDAVIKIKEEEYKCFTNDDSGMKVKEEERKDECSQTAEGVIKIKQENLDDEYKIVMNDGWVSD